MTSSDAEKAGPKPGDTFTLWGEDADGLRVGILYRVRLVELAGDDPMFYAQNLRHRREGGRWPVSMWPEMKGEPARGDGGDS